MKRGVMVSLVTRNDEAFVESCLDSVLGQTCPVRVRVLDSGSRDETVRVLSKFPVDYRSSGANVGYSRGHNANLEGEAFEFGLLLNADVVLQPDFVERLVDLLRTFPGAGMAGGKLQRMDRQGGVLRSDAGAKLDSTGIFFTPELRHLDRGSGEEDLGQYERRELVFGITGAALFFSRSFFDDVRLKGQFLDEEFFAYREDADLAWRAQLAGWRPVYEPGAVGLHFRRALPERRRQLDPAVNFHSVKNRFLMRTKNIDGAVRWRCFPHAWLRDLGILGYLLCFERSSLGALAEVRRLRLRTLRKRVAIQSARRVSPPEIARWFSFSPVSLPLPASLPAPVGSHLSRIG